MLVSKGLFGGSLKIALQNKNKPFKVKITRKDSVGIPISVCPSPIFANSLGRQNVGYGMVVDGFAKFQALNFGISGPEISEGFSFYGARQRNGEGVVRRNGCPKGCFWRVRFYSAPLRFSGLFKCF